MSLSARRAWIEIIAGRHGQAIVHVALRKESVDRNILSKGVDIIWQVVALRKESVDRNSVAFVFGFGAKVALRKESVDRNS